MDKQKTEKTIKPVVNCILGGFFAVAVTVIIIVIMNVLLVKNMFLKLKQRI